MVYHHLRHPQPVDLRQFVGRPVCGELHFTSKDLFANFGVIWHSLLLSCIVQLCPASCGIAQYQSSDSDPLF